MERPTAHIQAIGTAVPPNDVHQVFIDWASARISDGRIQALFRRMAARSGISHRWSIFPADPPPGTSGGFYGDGEMPGTAARMAIYAEAAPELALEAVAALEAQAPLGGITHLVVASCTGFVAPGVDQIIARRLCLPPTVERTLVGFMGCYAAVAALRVAHHIVRSDPQARVLLVAVELSTLHLQAADEIEPLLAMLQFADGAAAALITAEPAGLAIGDFFAATLPDSDHLIRWTIGDQGFVMHLSGEVPGRIGEAISMFGDEEAELWAVHPGGRSILDAVESGLGLNPHALAVSRGVLNDYGNMSSATLLFVLARIVAAHVEGKGRAIAFGPGLAAEGFAFRSVG